MMKDVKRARIVFIKNLDFVIYFIGFIIWVPKEKKRGVR